MLVLLVSLSALHALSVGPSASSEPTAPVSEPSSTTTYGMKLMGSSDALRCNTRCSRGAGEPERPGVRCARSAFGFLTLPFPLMAQILAEQYTATVTVTVTVTVT